MNVMKIMSTAFPVTQLVEHWTGCVPDGASSNPAPCKSTVFLLIIIFSHAIKSIAAEFELFDFNGGKV